MRIILLIFLIISSFSLNASFSIEVSISEQRLYLYEKNKLIRSYPVSSSAYGEGQVENSLKTPLGMHKIKSKIGTNVDKYHFLLVESIFLKK